MDSRSVNGQSYSRYYSLSNAHSAWRLINAASPSPAALWTLLYENTISAGPILRIKLRRAGPFL